LFGISWGAIGEQEKGLPEHEIITLSGSPPRLKNRKKQPVVPSTIVIIGRVVKATTEFPGPREKIA
jgi:hypothetical protein